MSRDSHEVQFPRQSGQCQRCDRSGYCLGQGLSRNAIHKLLNISASPRLLKRGQELFSEGAPFNHLYAVRSGAVKTFKITPDGEEQVIDFHLPGDLIGFNAIARGCYTASAIALDTTSVCAIRFEDLTSLCMRSALVQEAMFKRLSALMTREESFLVTIGTKNATQRLASFLVTLSNYFTNHGYSPNSFTLPMSRTDIANYLSLAVETVSRTLTRLQRETIIDVQRNAVEIRDRERLCALAGNAVNEQFTADAIH